MKRMFSVKSIFIGRNNHAQHAGHTQRTDHAQPSRHVGRMGHTHTQPSRHVGPPQSTRRRVGLLASSCARIGRTTLSVVLALGILLPASLTIAPLNTFAAPGDHYTVLFYADEVALQTAPGTPLYTYANEPEGTVITNPGLATPTVPNPNAHFLGWYVYNSDDPSVQPPDSQPYDFSQPLMSDLTLVARYRSDILVTFLDGYGKTFLTRQATPGTPITMPTAIEMQTFTAPSGYHFQEWTQNGALYTGEPLASDTTIEPTLSTGSVFVFFVSAGSQVPFETVDKGETASAPTPPTREGYSFQHWSTTADGPAFSFDTTISEDTTLYAVWQANPVKYIVLFWQEKPNIPNDPGTDSANYQLAYQFTAEADAGSPTGGINVDTIVSGQSAHAPSYSTYTSGDYSFSSNAVAGNGSTVLNVYFKRIVYTFTFTLDRPDATMTIGASSYTDATEKYSFNAKLDQDISQLWPTNVGSVASSNASYHFYGWLPDGAGVTAVSKVLTLSTDLLPTSGLTRNITGRWVTSGNTTTLHYLFESLEGNVAGAVAYNGKFYLESAEYSQSLFSSGTAPLKLKLISGLTGLTASALGKQGNSYVAVSTAAANQYLFYDRNIHRLSFEPNGGTLYLNAGMDYTKIKFEASLAPFEPSPPIKDVGDGLTYTFAGWYLDSAYHTLFDFSTALMGDADIVLFAKWEVSAYTVTVYDDLTTIKPLQTLQRAQGEYVGSPGLYDVGTFYEGKGTFEGWVVFIGPGATAPLSSDMPVTSDMAVHASWVTETYTITYTDVGAAGGTPPVDSTAYTSGANARVLGGASLDVPTTPVGTEFIGWRVSGAGVGSTLYYPGTLITVTGDITLDPVFETATPSLSAIVYRPNYLPDMSEFTPPSNVVQYALPGTTLTVPGFEIFNQSVPGVSFHFLGWQMVIPPETPLEDEATIGDVDYGDGDSLTVPSMTTTYLYALWSTTKYHLVRFDPGAYGTFHSGSQSIYSVAEGEPLNGGVGGVNQVNAPEPEPTPGYTFIGWSPEYSDASVIYADRVYVAQYEPIPPPPDPDMPHVPLTEDTPTPGEVYVAGYQAVYDGLAHSVSVTNGTPGNELTSLMTFHHEDGDPVTSWVYGNPAFTNVGDHIVSLAFTAQDYLFSSLFSYVDITPRPITVAATHADIPLNAPVPALSEYAVSVSNIVGNESFNANQLTLSTTYEPGDPIGTYPILAKPGIFGNYELPDPDTSGISGIDGKVIVGYFNVFDDGSDGVLDLTKAPATGQPLVVQAGDEVAYTITIHNSGTGNLNNVHITENMTGIWSDALGFDLVGALQTLDNSLLIATIPAGGTLMVNFTTVAGEGTVSNTVTGTSSGGGDTDTDTSVTGTLLDVAKEPAAGQPLVVETGDLVTYTITIRNLSEASGPNTTLSDVLITEQMTGGTWSNAVGFALTGADGMGQLVADSFTIPSIAAGAVLTVDYTVAATQGTNANTVTAADGGGGGGGGGNTDTDTDTSIVGGILDVHKAPAAGQNVSVHKGDLVTYTITIRNLSENAGDDLNNVVVTESMPGGTWSNASGFDLTSVLQPDNSLLISSLPYATSVTVDYTVEAAEGTVTNTVTATDGGTNGDNDTDTSITGGVLVVSKAPAIGQPLVVQKGDPVTYTITVENLSTAALSNVYIIEFMSGIWSNVPPEITHTDVDAFLLVPSLAAGTTLTLNYTVIANGGMLPNTVLASDDGNNTGIDTDVSVMAGTLSVEKAPAVGQPLVVVTGNPVTYTITLGNFGTTTLFGVEVTEVISGGTWSNPSGFALPGADSSGQLTADGFRLDSVSPNAVWTVDYTITSGANTGGAYTGDDGPIENSVGATDNWINEDSDDDNSVTVVSRSSDILRITKAPAAGQSATVAVGAPVTYTITIENVGTSAVADTLSDILISESMQGTWKASGLPNALDIGDSTLVGIDGSTLTIASMAAGTTYTVNYTVTATKGTMTNTVAAVDDRGDGDNTSTGTDTSITGTADEGGGGGGAGGGSGTPLPQSGDENGSHFSLIALLLLVSGATSMVLSRFTRVRKNKRVEKI